MIVEHLKKAETAGISLVSLADVYTAIEAEVQAHGYPFKMDTFRNTIRGELNKHEIDSDHPDCIPLFVRTKRGYYQLSDEGRAYKGR
jgi:hypothetical protein